MIALECSASLTYAFAVKAVVPRFRIEQKGIVFASIVALWVPSGLVMPDNFVFEAGAVGRCTGAKDFVQNNFCIVDGTPVQMEVETAIGGEQRI